MAGSATGLVGGGSSSLGFLLLLQDAAFDRGGSDIIAIAIADSL